MVFKVFKRNILVRSQIHIHINAYNPEDFKNSGENKFGSLF